MRKTRYKTVRCVIRTGDRFLLVVHRTPPRRKRGTWGLPGGRIEPGEAFEDTLRREIREELSASLGALHLIGDYRYRGSFHRVFGVDHDERILTFDRSEILKMGWHGVEDVAALATQGRLHTGFEELAIRDFLALST